ncbi:hypothetical protein SAG0162_12070 [Streptococcus agalactiae MRI Z1-214]|nr:hypothetical protein SAG0162_12070 [Streptococcus agalactiae MRI Z1-214]
MFTQDILHYLTFQGGNIMEILIETHLFIYSGRKEIKIE